VNQDAMWHPRRAVEYISTRDKHFRPGLAHCLNASSELHNLCGHILELRLQAGGF